MARGHHVHEVLAFSFLSPYCCSISCPKSISFSRLLYSRIIFSRVKYEMLMNRAYVYIQFVSELVWGNVRVFLSVVSYLLHVNVMLFFPCQVFAYIILFQLEHFLLSRIKFVTVLIRYMSPAKVTTSS